MICKARIIGTGSYLPKRVLTNEDLEKMVETSDEWIVSRTGMKERRLAEVDEYSSSMGVKAAQIALSKAALLPEEIDLILVATITPDYIFPSTACLIQKELAAKSAAALDIQAACTGYLYALSMAKGWVESGMYKNILIVATEKLSSITDYEDRSTCILFGDGAASCVVSSHGKGLIIEHVKLGADGEQADILSIPAGGSRHPASAQTVEKREHYIKMAGNELFKHAVRRMETACKECLEEASVKESDISWLVPHQANIRIIDAIAKRLEHLPSDRIVKTLEKYGNTSASSVGIALDELLRHHNIQLEEHMLLTAFGGGLTWGAALLRMSDES